MFADENWIGSFNSSEMLSVVGHGIKRKEIPEFKLKESISTQESDDCSYFDKDPPAWKWWIKKVSRLPLEKTWALDFSLAFEDDDMDIDEPVSL